MKRNSVEHYAKRMIRPIGAKSDGWDGVRLSRY